MKRVVGGFLVAGMLAGAGTTYAAQSDSNVLTTWYNQVFRNEQQAIKADTERQIAGMQESISATNEEVKTKMEIEIQKFKSEQTLTSQESINAYLESYLQNLEATKDSLKQNHDIGMKQYKEQLRERETSQTTQDTELMLKQILDNLP